MSTTPTTARDDRSADAGSPVLAAHGLVKRYGRVTAMNGADFEVLPGEIMAIIGDNGAGKSTLVKALSGAVTPDAGQILLDGQPIVFKAPIDAREAGIETVYQTLAVAPAMDIASNLFLGREFRKPGVLGSVFRMLDRQAMRKAAQGQLDALGVATVQNIDQIVETLSGGQRQAVAVSRAAMFGSKVVIMDEPTAALGVKESGQVLELIRRIRDRGLPVILISHNMPHVFEVADRIHVHRMGKRAALVRPSDHTMSEVVALMTGALAIGPDGQLVDAAGQRADVDEQGHTTTT